MSTEWVDWPLRNHRRCLAPVRRRLFSQIAKYGSSEFRYIRRLLRRQQRALTLPDCCIPLPGQMKLTIIQRLRNCRGITGMIAVRLYARYCINEKSGARAFNLGILRVIVDQRFSDKNGWVTATKSKSFQLQLLAGGN